jgi:hypothetical protein
VSAQVKSPPVATAVTCTHADSQQKSPAAQSESAAQVVLHAVAPHAYGAHPDVAPPPGQTPVSSQVDAAVATPTVHVAPHEAPGTHVPLQLPPTVPTAPTHAFAHVVAAPHCPSAPHVATCVSLVQRVAPVAHTPVQAPETHVCPAQGAPVSCQLPFASHTCGCGPLHPREPGLHATHPPPRQAGVAPWHASPTSCHITPAASHRCGCAPLQP